MRRARWTWACGAAALLATLGGGVRPASAGPARYDAETRSIRFTYTYASLAVGQFGEAAIGAPQTPSTEQDALVRTVVLKVSDALSKATSGRLKIASLDIVSDVRRADVVISLTGDPGRGGWAIPGAIEGRPGQIGLYYQTLAKEWEQDFVLTAAHEVCHYIFGLVDEYNFPSGCPRSNPGGPGCLMDNYLSNGTRHGWYGRLCATDHNDNPQQRQSCQEIVDKFFRDRGVTSNGPAEGGGSNVLARNDSVLDNITRATIARVREEAEALNRDRKTSSPTSLRAVARRFFEAQLKQNGLTLGSDEMSAKVDGILRQTASIVRYAIPPRFDPIVDLIAKFAETRARELRESSPKDSEATRRQKIARALLTFVGGLGANAPTVDGPLTAEEKRYLEQVAMQAAIVTEEKKANEELYDATMAHIKLDREIARNVLDIASEVGVVGMEKRIAAAGEVDADLRKYMPGRTASSGFGLRRTMILDPEAIDPRNDFVVTQTGIYRNADLREQYNLIFQRLMARARVELLTTSLQARRERERRESLGESPQERLRKDRLRRVAELADRNRIRSQREADLRGLLAEAIDEVRRNRVENIVFVVPPGGIPAEMSVQFETLRRALIIKGDVRLDIVVMGPADFPAPLRDIAIGSGGSVISFTSVDEVGALAQRLKNEQTSGSWVITPYQSSIRPTNIASRDTAHWLIEDARRGTFLDPAVQPIDGPSAVTLEWLEKIRAYFDPTIGTVAGASAARVDLELANLMPSEVIVMLQDAIYENLTGKQPRRETDRETGEQPRRETDREFKGLIDEIKYLTTLVQRFNKRSPGGGDNLQYEIIEHIIRARDLENQTRRLLYQALNVHREHLNPSYNEDAVFGEAYKETKKNYDATGAATNQTPQATGSSTPAPAPPNPPAPPTKPNPQPPPPGGVAPTQPPPPGAQPGATSQPTAPASNPPALEPPPAPTSPLPLPSGAAPPQAATSVLNRAAPPTRFTAEALSNPSAEARQQLYAQRAAWIVSTVRTETTQGKVSMYCANLRDVVAGLGKKATEFSERVQKDPSRSAELGPTIAYIELKQQEVRLRYARAFLEHLSDEISGWGDHRPLFQRIDREALVKAEELLADKAPGFLAGVPGALTRAPLPPVDTQRNDDQGRPMAIRLPRFYADNQRFDPTKGQAEFELILGFSQPLPRVDEAAIRDADPNVLPELRLYNDNGQLANTPSLLLDRDLSTPTCLIYRFSPEFGETGWYTAALRLNPKTRSQINDNIHFTFSVASNRPNFHLTAIQLQAPNDPELIPPPPNRGLARAMDRRVRLQVQVYGGTSILGASIRGVLYKLDNGTNEIVPIAQDFFDDGKTYGDLKADDGVYSSIISLDQVGGDNQGGGGIEYRVYVQAQSTETSRNIAPEDPNANDDERRAKARVQGDKTVREKGLDDTKTPEPQPAAIFQRATSIQIRVER